MKARRAANHIQLLLAATFLLSSCCSGIAQQTSTRPGILRGFQLPFRPRTSPRPAAAAATAPTTTPGAGQQVQIPAEPGTATNMPTTTIGIPAATVTAPTQFVTTPQLPTAAAAGAVNAVPTLIPTAPQIVSQTVTTTYQNPNAAAAAASGYIVLPESTAALQPSASGIAVAPLIPIADNPAAVGAYTGGVEPTLWKKPTMLFIGDSITEMGLNADGGWTARLGSAYSRKADVINRGFGGYTTATALLALPEIIESIKNQNVIFAAIWFGANDASLPDRGNAAANVPLEDYMNNLISIVKQLQQAGVLRIVLVTPPPVWEGAPDAILPGETLPHRTYKNTASYAAAVRAVSAQLQVPLLDMWSWFDLYEGWQTKLMLSDGLHMNPAGQEVTYNAFMTLMQTVLPEIAPASLPWHHPTWWFIDYKNASQQFAAEEAAYKAAHDSNKQKTAP